MYKLFLIPLLISLLLIGCSNKVSAADASVSQVAARRFSDELANDLIANRRTEIGSKLAEELKKNMDEQRFNATFDRLFGMFGRPMECTFKADEVGYKVTVSGKKTMRKFWYAVKTTKNTNGQYLFVEVVPENGSLKTSGFAIVSFPGGPPPNLQ